MAQHSGRVSITKWSEKRILSMSFVYHSHDTRSAKIRGKEVVKPISMLDFTHLMGGTNLKDQVLQSYLAERSE
jgi:hypothetical protein